LTFTQLSSQQVLRWRLFIEEYGPEFIWKKGSENIEADTLSRYPRLGGEHTMDESLFYNDLLKESFLNYPDDVDNFPLNFPDIAAAQATDPTVQNYAAPMEGFAYQDYHGTQLLCRQSTDEQWKIVIPEALINDTIRWYHSIMSHVGSSRLYDSLRSLVWFAGMRRRIDAHVHSCDACQRFKDQGRGQGALPPRNDTSIPFEEVAADLIGPWSIDINGQTLQIQALTIVDTATTLAEVIRIEDRSSQHVANLFDNNWLARYPRPLRCIFDQGGEFTGRPFQSMLIQNAIDQVPTTVKNPQANAVCERMHRTIKDSLRTICHSNPPQNVANAIELVDTVLASACYASRTAVHRTLGVSPGALVFGRDMLLPIPVLTDYNLIRQRRQTLIDSNNLRENRRRHFRDYSVGDEVMIKNPNPAGLDVRGLGPFIIAQVHVNGTVTIERLGNLYERINIRRLHPYRRQ
jgi:transposase InsO family protein